MPGPRDLRSVSAEAEPDALGIALRQLAQLQVRNEHHVQGWTRLAAQLLRAGYRGDGVLDGVAWLVRQLENARSAVDALERVFCASASRVQQAQAQTRKIIQGIVGPLDEDEDEDAPGEPLDEETLRSVAELVDDDEPSDPDPSAVGESWAGAPHGWHQAMAQVVAWFEAGCPGLDRESLVALGAQALPTLLADGVAALEPDGGESLRARDARVRQAVLDEPPMLEGLDVAPGTLSFGASHWMFEWVVRACRDVLGPAPNYMQVRATDAERGDAYLITVQRPHGKSPAQRSAELDEALRTVLDELERGPFKRVCELCGSERGSHSETCPIHRALMLVLPPPTTSEDT